MPTVLKILGFKFFFYSNEGNEPIHVHIIKGDATAKVWLEPEIEFEYSYGFTTKEQKKILSLVEENLETIKSKWYEHFGTK